MPRYTIDTGRLDIAEAAMVHALAALAQAESEDSREQARQELGHALLGARHWEHALWSDMHDFYRELLASNDNYPVVCCDVQDRWRDSPYYREWDWATDRLREWAHNPDSARLATIWALQTGRWSPPRDGYSDEPDDMLEVRNATLNTALLIADPTIHHSERGETISEHEEPFDMWTQTDFGPSFVADGAVYDGTVWSPDGNGGATLLVSRIDQQLNEKFLSYLALEAQLNGEEFTAAFRLPGACYDDIVVEVRYKRFTRWTATLHRILRAHGPGPWFGTDVEDSLEHLITDWAQAPSPTDTADELIRELAEGRTIEIDYDDTEISAQALSIRQRWDAPIEVPADVAAGMHDFDGHLQQRRKALNEARSAQQLDADRNALAEELRHRADQRHTLSPRERRLADLVAERGQMLIDDLNVRISDAALRGWYPEDEDAETD